ncbi:tetratricopeptide repeat protein [Aestuariispira insulae]|uniref:TPR repeat protein n=1 Tax=Aestuariispira insulae TaxID=1461337 RepID=A0A3D9HPK8_9PROT|nr:tetratricopeptide repeat protein [Aestuariispira insulae]RED51427.1 TPR repeat protein [Aestuariispira insulae]
MKYLVPLLFMLITGPALAQQDFLSNQEYKHCMQLTRINPEQAFEKALGWQDMGGGLPARHCAAVALISLEQYVQAAERLEVLAKDMPDDAPAGIVSDLLGQAGIAWHQAEDLDKAFATLSAALKLSPNHPVLLTDRAAVLVDGGKMWEAVDDLNTAIETNPYDTGALLFRGSAYRQLKSYDLALQDLNRVLELDSDNGEALFERGVVYRLTQKPDLARADWLKLIELHEGRPIADLARRNLEKLDLKAE